MTKYFFIIVFFFPLCIEVAIFSKALICDIVILGILKTATLVSRYRF